MQNYHNFVLIPLRENFLIKSAAFCSAHIRNSQLTRILEEGNNDFHGPTETGVAFLMLLGHKVGPKILELLPRICRMENNPFDRDYSTPMH
jgi:hypothetical protein